MRELKRLLGRKTMEVEILKEALAVWCAGMPLASKRRYEAGENRASLVTSLYRRG